MPYFVGLDASKKTTHICVMDRAGVVVREGLVASEPKAIVSFLRGDGLRYSRVGMETWTLAPWLYEGLAKAGLPIICIELRRAHGVMKAQRNKTDRNDARGIAEIMRLGAYQAVHIKSAESLATRALLTVRAILTDKMKDLGNSVHALLLSFGIKLPRLRGSALDRRARQLVEGRVDVATLVTPLLRARTALQLERDLIEARLLEIAKGDPVCQRLMTAPGVGPLTALIFRSSIDEPRRFAKSRSVGAHLGLTPRTRQSGEASSQGRITRWGDASVRRALFMAARSLSVRGRRTSWLTDWAAQVMARRGYMRGVIAVARQLAVVLHRMWVSETDFRWEREATT